MLAPTETPDTVTRVIESPEQTTGDKTYPKEYCAQMFCKEFGNCPVDGVQTRRFAEMQFGEWKPTKLEAVESLEIKIKIHGMKKVFP